MDDIYKNIEECNTNKKCKISTAFDDMISNKNLNLTITELIIRGRMLKFSLAFITKSYFAVQKNIRINSTHYFIVKLQTNENFNKLRLIIHEILTSKT